MMSSAMQENHTAEVKPDYVSLQQAAQWFAAFDSDKGAGRAAAHVRAGWQRWLEADPRHPAAWAFVEAVNADFDRVAGPGVHAALSRPAGNRRGALGALGALAVFGSVGLGSWLVTRPAWPDAQSLTAKASTGTGEVRGMALADGSQAWLNANTSLAIENSAAMRLVRLTLGELFIASEQQGKVTRRTLVVETPQGRIQALGTRFSVRATHDGKTQVAVFEGAVRITPFGNLRAGTNHLATSLTLYAGKQASFTTESIAAPEPDKQSRQSWVNGKLIADNMRLDDFLAELANYRHGHLGCDPTVAGLRIDGVFPASDTDEVLRMLEQTLPVRVTRTTAWWVNLTARG